MSDIVTTEEAAELAGVRPVTIRSWVTRGYLEPLQRGVKPLLFDYADVARVQRERRPQSWVRRHARAAARWHGLGDEAAMCNDSGAEEVRPEPDGRGVRHPGETG